MVTAENQISALVDGEENIFQSTGQGNTEKREQRVDPREPLESMKSKSSRQKMKETGGGETIDKQIVQKLKRDQSLRIQEAMLNKDTCQEQLGIIPYMTRIKRQIYKPSDVD